MPETAALIVTVALRAKRELSSFAALAVQLRYATSLGLTVEEPGLYALPTELGARVERVELSAAPVLGFFGKGERAPRLALPLGFVLDSFAPDVREQGVPSYSLSGLLLRAELIVPVLDRITVQLGPDASWLLAVDGSIRGDGTEGTGFALGVEASLRLELSAHLGLELHLRQSIAKAPGAVDAPGFEQRMRLATLSLAGAL